jgi:glutamate synthase (NADPH) small chain
MSSDTKKLNINNEVKPVQWTRADEPMVFMQQPRALAKTKSLDKRRNEFGEIYQEAAAGLIATQSARCLDCGTPYCEWKCPLHNYIPNWLEYAAKGQWIKAAEISHQTNSFPEICGRVCPQDRLCEGACTLSDDFGAVTIGHIEKFISEQALSMGWTPYQSIKPWPNKDVKRVDIIGAGPAGLACADVLIKAGLQVHVYDKHPEIGGLLMFGIPEFKLEKSVVLKRRQLLEQAGVVFHLSCDIGKDITFDQIKQQSDAVFLATGAYRALDGQLPGLESDGVMQALDYLVGNTNQLHRTKAKHGKYIDCKGKRVTVLGGGDTAMDCVRTAIRQGATSVTCVYRGTKEAMPGSRKEQVHAEEEGVAFVFQSQPTAIHAIDKSTETTTETSENARKDTLLKLDLVKTNKRLCRIQNKTVTEQLAGSEYTLETDVVILAFGFRPSPDQWLRDASISLSNQDKILVNDMDSMQTSMQNIYAGGDNVNGADLVVTAIAHGQKAAKQMIAQFQSAADSESDSD